MWQTIVVYIIGVVVFGYIAFKIYRLLADRGADPCIGCDGCELKSLMQKSNIDFQEKQKSCREEKHKKRRKDSTKSNCCG